MKEKQWLPDHYELPDGNQIRNLYVRADQWQLYSTNERGMALAVKAELHEKWVSHDYLEYGIFYENEMGLFILSSREGSMISSVEFGPFPKESSEALSFIRAMKHTRDRFGRVSFGDALFIAQFSFLLPTFRDPAMTEDAFAAGRFLTGGMNVPVTDSRRIHKYAPWLSSLAYDRILSLLELTADDGASVTLKMPADLASEKPAQPNVVRKHREGEFHLAGRPKLERFFKEQILHIIDHEEAYRRMGVAFPGAVLLEGPSGCGKTFAVDRFSEYLGWPVFRINSGNVGSKYIHETSRKISEMFDTAISNAPSILIIDELESFLSDRERASSTREYHLEEVAGFLRRIPEASQNHVLLFGMTNMVSSIDTAILRRGRFDHILKVDMPSKDEILSVFESLLSPLPTEGDLELASLAEMLQEHPISDISFIVREAGRLAVLEEKEAITADLLQRAGHDLEPHERKRPRIGFITAP